MRIRDVEIDETFAEAFPMTACRVIVTAASARWATTAGQVATGYASSVIGCDTEAAIEAHLDPDETPDGRPGVSLLYFAFQREGLEKAVVQRVGQCIMTCPTTACFDGLPPTEKSIQLGSQLRYFGDGWQMSKQIAGRRFWRIPVMDGEFLCEEKLGVIKGVAGGNFLILARTQEEGLAAAESAAEAIDGLRDVILPFPGGLVRSGSKVGSKYKKLRASTNDAYCPTLRSHGRSVLPEGVNAVYELVLDGLSQDAVERGMRVGIEAACQTGVVKITAGNYGGNLGPFHLHLHRILAAPTS